MFSSDSGQSVLFGSGLGGTATISPGKAKDQNLAKRRAWTTIGHVSRGVKTLLDLLVLFRSLLTKEALTLSRKEGAPTFIYGKQV